jgi:hypothetical protein
MENTRRGKVVGLAAAGTVLAAWVGCAPPKTYEGVSSALTPGTWTPVNLPFPSGSAPGTIALLTDGRVLLSGVGGSMPSNAWWAFKPQDNTGSYQNGSFTRLQDSPLGRWAHPSYMLPDGRFWTGGGEDVSSGTTRAEDEIYDPVTDHWTVAPDMPQEIADTPTALLGDGRILVLSHVSHNSYFFTSFGLPPSWSPAPSWSPNIGDPELSTLLLQDGSVLAGSRAFQRYQPWSNSWVNVTPPPGGDGVFMLANGSDEMGPMVLLPDGRAMVLGASLKSGLYNPATDGWTMAQDTPPGPNGETYTHADCSAATERNGRVLAVASTDPVGEGLGQSALHEYDPASDTWTQLIPPFTMGVPNTILLLALPSGQIWVSGNGSSNAWLYTPASGPQDAWRPIAVSVSGPDFGIFQIQGSRLFGVTTGADFGDDNKLATNFPIVSAQDDAGNIWYGRTMNFGDTTPRSDYTTQSFYFTLPDSMPDGSYMLHVAASGMYDLGTFGDNLRVTFGGPRIVSISGPNVLAAGQNAVATVTLDRPAPAPDGTIVQLKSNDPSGNMVGFQNSIVIPAGGTSGTVMLSGLSQAATGADTISASALGNARFAAKTVIGWSVASVSGPPYAYGANSTNWTVTIDSPAPSGGVVVNLQSTNTALVMVPPTVTVLAGQTSAPFPVTVVDPNAGEARINASLVNSFQSAPFGWFLSTLSGPGTASGASSVTWAVTLNNLTSPGGLVVNLQSSNPNVATVPASVTVPGGQVTATFPVTVVTAAAGETTITATLNDSFINQVFGRALTGLGGPQITGPGTSVIWSVTIDGASSTDTVINLQNDNPTTATVPATVTVPAGQTIAYFAVTANNLGAGPANITATLGGSSVKVRFGYLITSHTVSPRPLATGQTGIGAVTVNPAVLADGLTLTLTDPHPSVATISTSTLTFAPGTTTATYGVTAVSAGTSFIKALLGQQQLGFVVTVVNP